MYLPFHAWPVGFTADNTNPKADEDEWEAFWHAFARLQVRALIVEIVGSATRVPEQMLLEPLRKVTAEEFEVVLPWIAGLETTGEFRDAEFAVRRPPEGTVMHEWDVETGCWGVGLGKRRRVWGRLRRR